MSQNNTPEVFQPTEISRDNRVWFDARDIHRYVQSKQQFANWIQNRIAEIGAVEGVDYLINKFIKQVDGQGRQVTEYYVTPEMGQELGMLERNEKGREIRQWFIARNRRLEEIEANPAAGKPAGYSRLADLLDDPAQSNALMLELLTRNQDMAKAIADKNKQIDAMTPDVEAFKKLSSAEGSLCIRDSAKTLSVQEKKLIDHLKIHRWIYTRPGAKGYLAYAEKLVSGLMDHKTVTLTLPDGTEKVRTQAVITAKGLAKLSKELGGQLFN